MIQWQSNFRNKTFMVAKNEGWENRYSIDGFQGSVGNTQTCLEQHQKGTVIKQWRKECSETVVLSDRGWRLNSEQKGDENARVLHRANIQPFNVGLSASLTRCTIEKKREGEKEKEKKKENKFARGREQFPSFGERKKERTVVAEKGGWSNKNFWNKEAVGVSFSRKERVGILGRNKLEFLWMWNSLRLNNVKHVWCWWLCIYVVYEFLKKNKFRIVIVIAIISLFSFPIFFGKCYILTR